MGYQPLYSICQRYNFESNLQPMNGAAASAGCCIRYVKDTILKAIYNYCPSCFRRVYAVFDMSKIQFWKQFTTSVKAKAFNRLLYSICQRYNFESNLQLGGIGSILGGSCIRYVKDTILKAIYNRHAYACSNDFAVFDMSKIQFWKQFTTTKVRENKVFKLYSICQRYNFESNLQLLCVLDSRCSSCIRYVKDTILKAIYNMHSKAIKSLWAVFDMSKIQFWKQFTTHCGEIIISPLLYSICQRYNFESNLQHAIGKEMSERCCIRYVKDTILKAIYNRWYALSYSRAAVFDMSKIQFWKQFTTYLFTCLFML